MNAKALSVSNFSKSMKPECTIRLRYWAAALAQVGGFLVVVERGLNRKVASHSASGSQQWREA
jgi:hypothetical protein